MKEIVISGIYNESSAQEVLDLLSYLEENGWKPIIRDSK